MESQSDRQNNEPKTFCQSCKRYIYTKNFLIHQGRCQRGSELRSSRISDTNEKQLQSSFLSNKKSEKSNQYGKQQRNFGSKYSKTNLSKQYIGTGMKKKSGFQQKIPCHFCGYQQSLQQLDTHPNVCQHWQVQCAFCKSKFPKSLMNDHRQICQKNPENIRRNEFHQARNNQRNQMRRSNLQEEQYSDQQDLMPMFFQNRNRNMYRPSPLMDMLSFFGQGFNQRNQMRRQQQQGPNYQFVQFTNNNNGQPRIFIRSNSSNPHTFIQLIQMLAQRANPNQNPGLDERQLNKLRKIPYKKKNEQQADLCTICYCQFEENQQVMELSCKHIFHQECIFQWLKRVSTCPVCKKSMREGSQQQNQQNHQQNQHHQNQQRQHNQYNMNSQRNGYSNNF